MKYINKGNAFHYKIHNEEPIIWDKNEVKDIDEKLLKSNVYLKFANNKGLIVISNEPVSKKDDKKEISKEVPKKIDVKEDVKVEVKKEIKEEPHVSSYFDTNQKKSEKKDIDEIKIEDNF